MLKKNEEQQMSQQPKGFIASLETLSDDLLQLVTDEEPEKNQGDQLY